MSTSSRTPLTCAQFEPGHLHLSCARPVGAGAISQVVHSFLLLSSTQENPTPIAVKIISKLQVLQQKKVEGVMAEKEALLRLAPSPFIARLFGTAQSEDELFMVLEWLPHGDLQQHIRRIRQNRWKAFQALSEGGSSPASAEEQAGKESFFPPSSTAVRCLDFKDIQLITAQLVMALKRACEMGIVLRDFKPENIAFDDHHRACLIDFDTADVTGGEAAGPLRGGCLPGRRGKDGEETSDGTSRPRTVSEIQKMRQRNSSFCGTAQYVSPEMLMDCWWSYASDLWALGAIVYEMAYGSPLFGGTFTYAVLKNIMQRTGYEAFPRIDFTPPSGDQPQALPSPFSRFESFINGLLQPDFHKRLGVEEKTGRIDVKALREHEFFADFDWSIIDTQLEYYRPHDFRHPPRCEVTRGMMREQRRPDSDDSEAEEEETAASSIYDDGTPSLAPFYLEKPFNDPSYAEYVYRATADANPFEQLLLDGRFTAVEEQGKGEQEDAKPVGAEHEEESAPDNSSMTSEEDDVIDDVGMKFKGVVPEL